MEGGNQNREGESALINKIAYVDSILVFRHVEKGEIFGRILIENMSSFAIVFKLKTPSITDWSKFRIKSPIGLLKPGDATSIHIEVHPSTDFTSVNFVPFHVLVIPIPPPSLMDLNLNLNIRTLGSQYVGARRAQNRFLKQLWNVLCDAEISPEIHDLACCLSHKLMKEVRGIHGTQRNSSFNDNEIVDNGNIYNSVFGNANNQNQQMDFDYPNEEDNDEVKQLKRTVHAWIAHTISLGDKIFSMERLIWPALCAIIILIGIFGGLLQKYVNGNHHQPVQVQIQMSDSVTSQELLQIIKSVEETAVINQAAIEIAKCPMVDFVFDTFESIANSFWYPQNFTTSSEVEIEQMKAKEAQINVVAEL